MSHLAVRATPRDPLPSPPDVPVFPTRVMQQGIGAVMATLNAPIDAFNHGFAHATASLAKAWPALPAATLQSPALGLPHAHAPLPTLTPVIGTVLAGCCMSVMIGGYPAARVGDMGINPTCLGLPVPGFEIFTGSSKVFIGGARAARMFDITKHCWPPAPRWRPNAAAAPVVRAANTAMKGMLVAGMSAQALGVAADAADSLIRDPALASAYALSAQTGAAQLAMDAAALVFAAMLGKNPCIGSPTGAITYGTPNVLIGGFPVPSGLATLLRKLAGAELPPRRRGKNRANRHGNMDCG